jgi:hypothetical protein
MLYGDMPYEKITLKTLKRFYITKYTSEWLIDFPQMVIQSFDLNGNQWCKYANTTDAYKRKYVRHFLEFCHESDLNKADLLIIGW